MKKEIKVEEPKKVETPILEKESLFLWNWTRITFWVMMGFWLVIAIFSIYHSFIIATTWLLSSISCLVLSIIHLTKYKQKAFAITAVCCSGYLLITFFIGVCIALSPSLINSGA